MVVYLKKMVLRTSLLLSRLLLSLDPLDCSFRGKVLCSVFTRCICELEPFVVGGAYAKINNFPHAVYLSAECRLRWICGASILNQRMLITAAHCLSGCHMNQKSHAIQAYAGHENLEKVKTTRSVMYIKIHADYDEDTVVNDIGLAVLKKDFPLGNTIKRVIIARRFPEYIKRGVVAGWGIVDDDTEENTVLLKYVAQRIRSDNVCAQLGKLEKGMFCAGSTSALADHPARGDSGSALITATYEEIGLVSFRLNRLPSLMVYTNVTYYYDWIDSQATMMFCRTKGK